MTYDEIKKRLTEVETTLQSMRPKKSTQLETSYTAKSINTLTTLKESLQKLLAEKEETMFISTKGGDTKAVQMDRKTAMDLKKDPAITGIDTAKGQSLKELDRLNKNSGIEFDKNETGKVATMVGRSLAIALKKAGDELARMKAHRIDINSFDIEVTYKGEGGSDEFSFYISDDSLHLVDFSFDKELVSVGVKPSGEAIINVDVLANELLKHFKSLNEEAVVEGAIKDMHTFLNDLRDSGVTNMFGAGSYLQKEFGLDKKEARQVLTNWMKSFGESLKEQPHQTTYIKVSKRDYKKAMSILDNNIDPTYVKMDIVDNDGDGNVIIYFNFKHEAGFDDMYDDSENKDSEFYQEPAEDPAAFVYDVAMDLQAQGIEVVDASHDLEEAYDPDQEQKDDEEDHGVAYDDDGTPLGEDLDVGHQDDEPSMLKSSAFETATYAAKLAKKLAQYDQVDGEVDFPNWWQKKLILARDYMSAAYHYLDSEEKQPLIDKLALEHTMNEGTELYDKGGMQIKRFSGGKRGVMVQITVPSATGFGGDYIQVTPDQFATLAKAMQSVQGDLMDMSTQIPRRKNIDEIKAAKIQKAHGQVVAKMKELAKLYKAGDKSVVSQLKDLTGKKNQLEKHLDQAVAGTHRGQELTELSGDQREAIMDLQSILDDLSQKGEEAREIVRQSFPNMLSKGDAYGAFEFGTSGNRYDTTLESIIEDIEQYYDEEEEAGYASSDDPDSVANEAELNKPETKQLKKIVKQLKKSVKGHGAQADYLGKLVKEFTDNRFTGADLIDDVSDRSPDMFDKQLYADLLPKGIASENDAIEALKAHDKSPIKARMGQHAPMFVHVQYHKLEHQGVDYEMHQTQYYNSNFKDKDPSFNPGVSKITLIKDPEGEHKRLGTILVKTDEYVQDLRNLPGLGKRFSEAVKEASEGQIKVGDILTKDGKKGKVVKVMDDMANVDFGNGDVYGITFGRIKGSEIVKENHSLEAKDMQTLKDAFNHLFTGTSVKFTKLEDLRRVIKYLMDTNDANESAPGYKHDCAAKVVHETYGVGICIPEKHTLIKEGSKYVVTHYDVLFKEGKKVVADIPVEDLKIVTQKEHWHKGYKKKKK